MQSLRSGTVPPSCVPGLRRVRQPPGGIPTPRPSNTVCGRCALCGDKRTPTGNRAPGWTDAHARRQIRFLCGPGMYRQVEQTTRGQNILWRPPLPAWPLAFASEYGAVGTNSPGTYQRGANLLYSVPGNPAIYRGVFSSFYNRFLSLFPGFDVLPGREVLPGFRGFLPGWQRLPGLRQRFPGLRQFPIIRAVRGWVCHRPKFRLTRLTTYVPACAVVAASCQ